jgi:hypothetical protein
MLLAASCTAAAALLGAGCRTTAAGGPAAASDRSTARQSQPDRPAARATLIARPVLVIPTGKRHQSYVVHFQVQRVEQGEWNEDLAIVELSQDHGGRQLLQDLGLDKVSGPYGWRGTGNEQPLRIIVHQHRLRGGAALTPGLVVNAVLQWWDRP